MNKSAKRWLAGALGLTAVGALGTTLLIRRRRKMEDERPARARGGQRNPADRWARPGMVVTFRAELMPGRDPSERTFRVARLLPSSRITLEGFAGEHTETEFETLR